MFEIGASLAAARRARGLDLRAAEHLTCMRGRYLLALEEERFDQLPGRTYARAFLRTYAAALGLEADRFVAEFDEQVPPEEPVEAATTTAPRRARRSLRTPLVLAAAAALAGIVFWSGWNRSSSLPTAVATPKPPVKATAASLPPVHHVTRPKVSPALLVVRATGPCWIELRRGDANGPVLAIRTLQAGDVVRVTLARVWVRLGAPWNVTVRRGATVVRGLPRDVPVSLYWTSAPGHVSESR
jgi:cytoskeletal protein RodZ